MHYSINMAVVDAAQQLPHIQPGFVFSKNAFLDDPIKKLAAAAVLSHDVEVFGLGVDIVESDYVGVVLCN